MATSKDTVAYVLEQLEPLDVRARAMFGEYGFYCDNKIVGFSYAAARTLSARAAASTSLASLYR